MSILIIIALVAIIGLLIILTKLNVFNFIRVSRRVIKIILIVYLLALLVSLPVLYLLPRNQFPALDKPDGSEIAQAQQKYNLFKDYADKGELDKINGVNKNNSYQFLSQNKVLRLVTPGYDSYPIWIEQKEADDGIINAETYTTPYVTDGVDITNSIPPVSVEFKVEKLIVLPPKGFEVRLVGFAPNILLSQFKKDSTSLYNRDSSTSYLGVHPVYIKVPAGMSVEKGKAMVTFVKRRD
jgi:hypothetical protein